ncbi:MAG: flagellar biosynthesis anti-sigma factor FlgM [Deltaproteobacteria bacterium]|nr:flagellar biosynthesis anti-sigma factor FlgM [Deltaproteobacteria bacterium]
MVRLSRTHRRPPELLARIRKLKRRLAEGKLEIDSEKLADALLDKEPGFEPVEEPSSD